MQPLQCNASKTKLKKADKHATEVTQLEDASSSQPTMLEGKTPLNGIIPPFLITRAEGLYRDKQSFTSSTCGRECETSPHGAPLYLSVAERTIVGALFQVSIRMGWKRRRSRWGRESLLHRRPCRYRYHLYMNPRPPRRHPLSCPWEGRTVHPINRGLRDE